MQSKNFLFLVKVKTEIVNDLPKERRNMKLLLSEKEIIQMNVFEKLKSKSITQKMASRMVKLSVRQIRNKLNRYKEHGVEGLIHKNRGKISSSRWNEKEKQFVMKLFEGDFHEFGPTFASEKLEELHSIKVSRETLRKAMIKHGVWRGKSRKPKHRTQRPRKNYFGEMVQLDGSDHDWFEGRDKKCTLLVYIDDATSSLLWLEFVPSESYKSVANATINYFEKWGFPISLYTDFGSVFSVNTNNPDRTKLTQFERANGECMVNVIHAHSPQAKGRVERANSTLQNRLIKEMRLAGISDMDAANVFVRNKFIDQHNKRFAKKPLLAGDIHRSIDGLNLKEIFSLKEKRVLQNDFVVRYKKRLFQLKKEQKTIIRPKDHITVCESLDSSIVLSIRKIKLFYAEIQQYEIEHNSNTPWDEFSRQSTQQTVLG